MVECVVDIVCTWLRAAPDTESEREDHLEMLALLDQLMEKTPLCERLRASNSEEDVRNAIRECEALL